MAEKSAVQKLRSPKQRAFVEHYLQCWNASEAARRAGYSERTAGSQGHELLKKPEVQAAIEARLEELTLSSREVLLRLSEHARASIEDFVVIDELSGEAYFDFARAKQEGKLHLIKKLWQDKDGRWRVELVDSQAALVHIGRHYKLFTDNVDVHVKEPITIIEPVAPPPQEPEPDDDGDDV